MIANNAVLSVSCFPVQSYVHCTKDNDFYNLMHKCTDLCDTSLLWGTCTCNCKIIIPVSAISMIKENSPVDRNLAGIEYNNAQVY